MRAYQKFEIKCMPLFQFLKIISTKVTPGSSVVYIRDANTISHWKENDAGVIVAVVLTPNANDNNNLNKKWKDKFPHKSWILMTPFIQGKLLSVHY